MARAAIVRRGYRAETGGIHDKGRRRCALRQVHRSHVLGAGSMTSLTGYTRSQMGGIKMAVNARRGAMATKA